MRRVAARLAPAIAAVIAIGAVAAPVSAVAPVVPDWPQIDGDRLATNDLHVTIATPATNAVTMKVSNDGLAWKTMAWTASIEWDLDDAAYGGDATPELKHVYVWFDNGTDTWDIDWQVSDIIWYDIQPPVETELRVALWLGATVSTSGLVPVRSSFFNKDNVGTEFYDADDQIDGGPGWTQVADRVPFGGVRPNLSAGHTHRLRVRGIDYAGNVGDWLTGSTVRLTAYQESSSRIHWKGSWSRITGSSLWGGAARKTTYVGASAKMTFTGNMVGVVVRTGPKRGVFTIYIDGKRVDIADTAATHLSPRRVMFTKWWATSAKHTIRVKLQDVPHRTRGELDAFVVGS